MREIDFPEVAPGKVTQPVLALSNERSIHTGTIDPRKSGDDHERFLKRSAKSFI